MGATHLGQDGAMSRQPRENEELRILDFWWMVELFSPQPIPKVPRRATRAPDRQVIAWAEGDALPWDDLPPPERIFGAEREWRHTVYLGVYNLEATYESLQRVFGEDKDAYDERPGGESACAGLVVGHDGRLVVTSAVLSSALWAAARIHDPASDERAWMHGFTEASALFLEELDHFEAKRKVQGRETAALPCDEAALIAVRGIAQSHAGVKDFTDLASKRVVIESVAVVAKPDGDDVVENDFLNSLYLDDLADAREQVIEGNVGTALATYLTGDVALRKDDRIDVVRDEEAVNDGTTLERLPRGRWPQDPEKPLALSQQFAVNEAFCTLGPGAGLMGVNGPPGTGKTTMLRDILAGNVVERARQLATLEKAHDAFTDTTHRWKAGEYQRSVRQLRPELIGFEMVVASANNAAVENISDEIPGVQAIDKSFLDRTDYFRSLATEILRQSASGAEVGSTGPPTAWGLVAARLGNKRNRSIFRSSFWFDGPASAVTDLEHPDAPGMQTLLKRWRDGEVPHKSWTQARHDFGVAERRVDAVWEERRHARERMRTVHLLKGEECRLLAAISEHQQSLQQIRHDLIRLELIERQTHAVLEQAILAHGRRMEMKPGRWETIFSLGNALRQWRTQLTPVNYALVLAEGNHHRAADQDHQKRNHWREVRSHLATQEKDLELIRQRLPVLQAECSKDESRYGKGYPGEGWIGETRELSAPWLDPELDAARSELFLAALDLHKDFMAVTASDMIAGLRSACDVVTGNYPRGLEAEKLRAAWQLFFLVVPLVSTTFASASRMFGNIGREAIGWLLIDEAGQASPQYAVGAMWRACRVIAVGDPMQLQPVVTIPHKVQSDIASGFGVSDTWIPPLASVQSLADRVSVFGTTLKQGDEGIWVSAPLRVHRRCDEPMFSLCNDIAYGGIMINGVHRKLDDPEKLDLFDRLEPPTAIIAKSHWADEPADKPGTHLQPGQIDRVERAIDYLCRKGIRVSDIIVISPFREVADRLRSLARGYPGLLAGTIHTAQGREASVVILVLGGDPDSPGAKAWAASTPNLVNVAASRAKRRLYVIGDRAAWSSHPYFLNLSEKLT